ncbi:protein kinase [uncultured Fibrobacter sp.]
MMSIAMQSIAGIEHSHTNNVIHKDIKPANIMVTRKGIAKITDFAL